MAYKVNESVWTRTYALHMVEMIAIQCMKEFLVPMQHVEEFEALAGFFAFSCHWKVLLYKNFHVSHFVIRGVEWKGTLGLFYYYSSCVSSRDVCLNANVCVPLSSGNSSA